MVSSEQRSFVRAERTAPANLMAASHPVSPGGKQIGDYSNSGSGGGR